MPRKKAKPTKSIAEKAMDIVAQKYPELNTNMRNDAWLNDMTGLGTFADKATQNRFEQDAFIWPEEAEGLYTEEVPSRIVDKVVKDATQQKPTLIIEDDSNGDQANDIISAFEDLNLFSKLKQAAKWGRLFGFGAVQLLTDDITNPDDLQLPLDIDRVNQVRAAVVYERRDIAYVWSWTSDPLDPNYALPEVYVVRPRVGAFYGSEMLVHHSRMLIFEGQETPKYTRLLNMGFSLSVLQRPKKIIEQHEMTWAAVSNILQDAAQAVFKTSNVIGSVAAGNENYITARMIYLNRFRSVARALVIDKDKEDFERKDYSFSGYEGLIDKFIQRLCMAAEMPATVLFGVSPAGMNATGESDIKLWEKTVGTWAVDNLQPKWEKLVCIFGKQFGLTDENWSIEPKPLREMDRTQEATIRYQTAQTDEIYIRNGVVTAEEVALSRFGARGWSAETKIDNGIREAVSEEDTKAALEMVRPGAIAPTDTKTPPDENA